MKTKILILVAGLLILFRVSVFCQSGVSINFANGTPTRVEGGEEMIHEIIFDVEVSSIEELDSMVMLEGFEEDSSLIGVPQLTYVFTSENDEYLINGQSFPHYIRSRIIPFRAWVQLQDASERRCITIYAIDKDGNASNKLYYWIN